MTPRAVAGQEERDRIVEAAYRILAATAGPNNVSVREILREAGLSTRAFYRHFQSKDDLLLAMLRAETDAIGRRLDAVAAAAGSPAAALRGWIQEMMAVTSSPKRRLRALALSSDEAKRALGVAGEQQRLHASQESVLARVLADGLADGSLPWADVGSDAHWIRALVGQAFDDQMADRSAYPAAVVAEQVGSFVLRALGHR